MSCRAFTVIQRSIAPLRRRWQEQLVPVARIVPGDVIWLSAGNLNPADGRVMKAQDFLGSGARRMCRRRPSRRRWQGRRGARA